MNPGLLLFGLTVQAPTPVAAHAAELESLLAHERPYAAQLGRALGRDLRRDWIRYAEHERDKASDRAEGDDDEDDIAQGFGDYLDMRYRRRTRLGILMFSVGFAPFGFGLYTGLTLGEGSDVMLGLAGVGAAAIVTGAVLWGVRGVQLRRYRQTRATLDRQLGARMQWRGLAPLYLPGTRTHGVSLGFAF